MARNSLSETGSGEGRLTVTRKSSALGGPRRGLRSQIGVDGKFATIWSRAGALGLRNAEDLREAACLELIVELPPQLAHLRRLPVQWLDALDHVERGNFR